MNQKELLSILDSLGYGIKTIDNRVIVTVPTWKPYIDNKEAVYADALRIYGYDNIPIPGVMSLKLRMNGRG